MMKFPLHNTIVPRLAALFVTAFASLAAPATLPADYFGTSTPLGSGRWVKINVSETGMQEITADELAAMGFSDPAKVAVCGYGGAMLGTQELDPAIPDRLAPVPSMVVGGKLVFYGEGAWRARPRRQALSGGKARWEASLTRNNYSTTGSYFLTEAVSPAAPAAVPRVSAASAPSLDEGTWGFVPRVFSSERNGLLGGVFFGPDLVVTGPQTYYEYLPAMRYSTTAQDSNRGLHFYGAMAIKSLTQREVAWAMPSGTYTYRTTSRTSDQNLQNYRHHELACIDIPRVSADSHYPMTVYVGTTPGAIDPQLQYGAVDFYTLTYLRDQDFSDTSTERMVTFTSLTDASQELVLAGASSTAMVWDITDPLAPRNLLRGASASDAGDGAAPDAVTLGRVGNATDGTAPLFVVFDPAETLHKVTPAGEVSCANLHSLSAPHMVIVAAKAYMAEAERLARVHTGLRGIDAVAVCQDDVFNEFSSGTRTHEGIRRFARMLLDRGPGKFRSMLLLGYGSSDNAGINNREADFTERFVPIYECPHLSIGGHHSLSYSSDIFYGVLGDDFSIHNALWPKMDIAVGRLPAQNAEQAADMVDKIEQYLLNPPSTGSTNRALLLGDTDSDNNFVGQAESLADIIVQERASTMTRKGYTDLFPNADQLHDFIIQTLQEGVCFMSYFGHGSANGLGLNGVWTSSLARGTTYPVPPLVVMGTCSPLAIDLSSDCVGAWMFANKSGGAIGVVGAQREVYMNYNFDICEAVTRHYFGAEPSTTLGEIFRQAVNSNVDLQAERNRLQQEEFDKNNPGSTTQLPVDSALLINTHSYTFIGDPEIPAYAPSYSMRLATVAGTDADAATSDSPVSVNPLEPFAVTGEILDGQGRVDTSFNGTAILMVYDSPRVLEAHEQLKVPIYIDADQYTILNVKAEVKEGRFSTTLTVPVPARPGGSNTVSLYAMSDNGFDHANGVFRYLRVEDSDPSLLPEAQDPVVSAMWIDTPSFVSGQVTGSEITLHAEISDPSGIVGVTSLFGNSLTVSLDDSKNIPGAGAWLSTDTRGNATLDLPVTGLVDGLHTLTLTARGNAGGVTRRSIDFTVVNTPAKAVLSTAETTAVTEATIDLSHDFPSQPEGRLVITDSRGNTVYHTDSPVFPLCWDLKDASGIRQPDGVYTATAYLRQGLRYAAASTPVVILTPED